MEKYSAYRDPGTGIQPFLTPVPPQADGSLVASLLRPFSWIIGGVRLVLVIIIGVLYAIFVNVLCLPLYLMPPLYGTIRYTITSILARLCLFILGFIWINVETVSRKKGRALPSTASWKPDAGDIIVSNWLSYVELLWLAFRFDPVFVLPVTTRNQDTNDTTNTEPVTSHRRSVVSANALPQSPRRVTKRVPVKGFQIVSLLEMLNLCGQVPPYKRASQYDHMVSIGEIQLASRRPIVVFPECTTSNGRGILRFADVLQNIKKGSKVFVMCVRVDAPTQFSPTISCSVPCRLSIFNPLPHMFRLSSSLLPHNFTIRLLAPSDGSSILNGFAGSQPDRSPGASADNVTEAYATMVGEVGRIKRVGFGWEDKEDFLNLYRAKTR